jgi:hypothetical protein
MLPVQCNRTIDGIHFSRKAYHGEHNDVDERHVSGEYLSMLKARLLRGRSFTDADDSSRAGVAVINQALAQKYFPGEDPVGKRIANDEGGQSSLWEIVGVVDDVREGPLDARTMAPFQFLLSQRGGKVPSARWRSLLTLTLAEREDISRGIASASSIREIAKGLQRAASRVSREVARHGGRPLYRANEADHQAWESALRPKACLLATHVKLRTIDGRSERTILRTA